MLFLSLIVATEPAVKVNNGDANNTSSRCDSRNAIWPAELIKLPVWSSNSYPTLIATPTPEVVVLLRWFVRAFPPNEAFQVS